MSFGPVSQFGAQPNSIFSGATPPNADPNFPGMGGLGALGQMLGPLLAGYMAGPNSVPGQFLANQSNADYQRALAFQTQQMEAAQIAGASDAAALAQTLRGAHSVFGGFPLSASAPGTAIGAQIETLSQDYGAFAPYLGAANMIMPGLGDAFMDLGGGNRGWSGGFANQAMLAGRYRPDVLTGDRGMSAETGGQLTIDVGNMLYGSGAGPNDMRGYGMSRAGEMLAVSQRLGIGPGGTASAGFSRAEIDALRHSDAPAGLSPSDLRALSGDTNVSAADMQSLSDSLQKSGSMDAALRNFDAKKVSARMKELAGLMSAMEDLYGPNQGVEQMITAANAITMGGGISDADIATKVQTMRAATQTSGIGVDQFMRLSAMAGDVAVQAGGTRSMGFGAARHAQDFATAWRDTQRGAGDARAAGVSVQELNIQDTALTARAAASPVAGQMAATLRIAEMIGFNDPNSRAAKLAEAIRGGQSTYEWEDADGGKHTGSTYVENESEWRDMMAADATGLSASGASSIRAQTDANRAFGARHDVARTARGMQWDVDLRRSVRGAFSASVSGQGGLAPDQAKAAGEALEEEAHKWRGDASKDPIANRMDMVNDLTKILIDDYGMDPGAAKARVVGAMGTLDARARGMGYKGGFMNMQLAHNPELLAATAAAGEEAELEGEQAQQVSGFGRGNWLRRGVTAIGKATKDTPLGEIIGKMLGAIGLDEIPGGAVDADAAAAAVGDSRDASTKRDDAANLTGKGERLVISGTLTIPGLGVAEIGRGSYGKRGYGDVQGNDASGLA